MKTNLHVFDTVDETIRHLAEKIYAEATAKEAGYFHLAISGGSSPLKLFDHLKEQYASSMPWNRFRVFWVDERCVPADDLESNYGAAYKHLLGHVQIPEDQIFRIRGEAEPYEEAERYTAVLQEHVPIHNGYPSFDFILLGMGADGHFASIFPGQMHLIDSDNICGVTMNPISDQKRVSLSGAVINRADFISFLVAGEKKASALTRVMNDRDQDLPASFVNPVHGVLEWYVDKTAAQLLTFNP